ncbi:MAG: carotenoid biosynthesis protein [Methanobacteriaceae archaeon]|nr:carotenoid biosynthesis protein [Methanobacteriaceae archaeon]
MKDLSKIIFISAVVLSVAAFFVTNVPISSDMAPISGFFIIFLALPAYGALVRSLGWYKALILIIVLSLYAIFIETMAIITGIPYSHFQYSGLIGLKLFGHTPYTVPFAYVPLFIGCFYLAILLAKKKWRIITLSTLLVVVADLVLDPGAVALNFWTFQSGGFYYGVPLSNFLGWIITGFIASSITLYLLKDNLDLVKVSGNVSSLFLILFFWSSVCLYIGLLIPTVIGFSFIAFILIKTRGRIACF